MADAGQRTEQPTQKRLEKARQEGRFPSVRQFVTAVQFCAFVAILSRYSAEWSSGIRVVVRRLLLRAFGPELTPAESVQMCLELVKQCFVPLAMFGAVLILLTLALQLAATRLGVSLKLLAPDLKRLSPMSKLKQIPRQNIPALLQAMLLLPIFGYAVYVIAQSNMAVFLALPFQGVEAAARTVALSVEELLWKAAGAFVLFGCVDLFRQLRRHQQDLRMSRQEVRDEAKESEGNPEIKMRIRRLRRDQMRKRMMQEVPKATAVVVNPTHYAVALRYTPDSMTAPLVVAKGRNYLALRIRQRALENQVPLVENPPLAQALYKSVEVGQEIPAHLFRAVAEVLAYIYRLMRRG